MADMAAIDGNSGEMISLTQCMRDSLMTLVNGNEHIGPQLLLFALFAWNKNPTQ